MGNCWGEEVVFWKYQEKELSLTHNQVPVIEKVEEKVEEKVNEVPF
jgi:hypothetical protein